MKIAIGLSLFCLAVVMAPSNAAPGADPAMLTNLGGTVEVKRAGQPNWQGASLMALLKDGDSLRTGQDSSATVVFFADGHREKLLARTSGVVARTSMKPLRGSRRVAVPAGRPEPSGAGRILAYRGGPKLAAGYASAAGRPGAIGMREPFRLIEPLGPAIRGGRPALKWAEKAGADTYRLRILAKGQEPRAEVVSLETKATAAPYPEGAGALQPGTVYAWELDALVEGLLLARESGELDVIDAASRESVEREEAPLLSLARAVPEETTAFVLLACLYTRHELYGEAIEQYRRALALRPKDAGLHREMGWLYRHVDLETEARRHFAAAGIEP